MPVETIPTTMAATISAASPASAASIRSNLVVSMAPSSDVLLILILLSVKTCPDKRAGGRSRGGRVAEAFDEKSENVGLGDAQLAAIAVRDGIAQHLEGEQARQQGGAVGDGPSARLERGRQGFDLALALRQACLAHHRIGRIERAQAGAKHPPFAVMLEDRDGE